MVMAIWALACVMMRKAGYDAMVFEGKAEEPTIVKVEDDKTEFLDGKEFWGLGTFETEKHLKKQYGDVTGVVSRAQGVRYASEKIHKGSENWAMQVKGLEISAYDCHTTPAIALAYGTAASGAHHKDSWVISWEVKYGRESYDEAKVDEVIELQRIRGGMFESLTTCRLPWVEVGFELDWYPKYLKASTGMTITLEDAYKVADRIYAIIRSFWVREFGKQWSSAMDIVPARWFTDALTKGPLKGRRLNKAKYESMLQLYYEKRGWDNNGISTKTTLTKLGLADVATELSKRVSLTA
jgi:aldehyde:ferredoxin oxidoreductase